MQRLFALSSYLLFIILFTINWMYLTPDKLRWAKANMPFPVVKYKINPAMIGFNTGEKESIIESIRNAGTNHKKSYNLFTVLAKQFGQLLGLSHCSPGENESICQERISLQGTSNPTTDSLLYKFVEPEVIKNSLQPDDAAGLRALYGDLTEEEKAIDLEMKNFADKARDYCIEPCVTPDKETNTKYALSEQDIAAIDLYWRSGREQGKDSRDFYLEKYRWMLDSYTIAFSANKKSAEHYMLDAIEKFHYYQDGDIREAYLLERMLLSVQISIRQKFLDDAKYELDSQFYIFIENEQKILIQLRRMFIDAL